MLRRVGAGGPSGEPGPIPHPAEGETEALRGCGLHRVRTRGAREGPALGFPAQPHSQPRASPQSWASTVPLEPRNGDARGVRHTGPGEEASCPGAPAPSMHSDPNPHRERVLGRLAHRTRHPRGQHTEHTLSHPARPWWGEVPAARPPHFRACPYAQLCWVGSPLRRASPEGCRVRAAMTRLPPLHGRRGEGTPRRCVSALPARPGRQAPPHPTPHRRCWDGGWEHTLTGTAPGSLGTGSRHGL